MFGVCWIQIRNLDLRPEFASERLSAAGTTCKYVIRFDCKSKAVLGDSNANWKEDEECKNVFCFGYDRTVEEQLST